MTKQIEYEYLEVPASEEKAYARQGWEKYGMRANRDERFSKLRRPLGKEKTK
jgi:hypothetical protein